MPMAPEARAGAAGPGRSGPDLGAGPRSGPDAPRLVLQDQGGTWVRVTLYAGPDQLGADFNRAQLAWYALQLLEASLRPGEKKPPG